MTLLYVLLAVALVVVLWGISQYNFFVSTKARIKAAVQEIGNQLKRQADLIPNLESSAKGYMKHEKGIFQDLTEARKAVSRAIESGDVQKMSDAGSRVAALVPQMQVLVESNPQLQAAGVVTGLMNELRDTADKVMYARRLVIDLTADYNVARATFPSSIVAGMFNFTEQPGLITPETGSHVEVSNEDMKTPKVDLG
jgi:LemA protein